MAQVAVSGGLTPMRSATLALVLMAGVIVFARLHAAPEAPALPDAARARPLFTELANGEPGDWKKAREDWAQHRWSQQDAFGALEASRVRGLASREHLFPQDVFALIDEGIRAKWPGPGGLPLEATVVPLKPRPMD